MKTNPALLLAALAVVATASLATATPTFTATVTGQGRPMILIPGLACPGEVWDATVARFDDDYECHVLSLSGFGGTPARASAEPMLATVRDELAAYIRAHKLDRPVIVGHSLGGFLALDLAATDPELPGALVLVDSLPFVFGIMQPGASSEDAKRVAAATAGSFGQMDAATYAHMIRNGPNGSTMAAADADLERIIAWGLASDAKTVSAAMTELYGTDLRPKLGAITTPALVLAAWVGYAPYSSHDYVEKTYRDQYAGLSGFRLEITDTARHFIMFDEPEWTFAQIEGFLAANIR